MAVVIPFIGAAIGGAIGGTFLGVGAATWGYFAGSLLASALFKPPGQQGPRLEDLTIVGTDYGQAIPWVSGSPRIAPQYAWISPLREIASTQKVGKGGSQKITTYTYECDFLLIVTENVTADVARDWLNGELIRNGLTLKDGVYGGGVTIYTGADGQLPDPTYETAVGAGNAPAYRGHTTIVGRSLQLGGGKQMPNLENQVNTLNEIDQSGLMIDAPLNEDTELNDLISPAQTITAQLNGALTALDFTPTSVRLRRQFSPSGRTAFGVGSGDFFFDVDWETQDRYVAFDYDLGEPTIIAPIGLPPYQNATTALWQRNNGLGSHSLVVVDHDSVGAPGQSFDLRWAGSPGVGTTVVSENMPLTGRMTLIWPAGTLDTLIVKIDNEVFMTVVGSNQIAGATGSWSMGQLGITDIRGALFLDYQIGRLMCGVGTDPIYLPPLQENLRTTLRGLLARCGYAQTQYDVHTDLSSVPLEGYATSNVTSTRAHLETLRPYGLYECSCSDKLYVFPRAETPAGAIPWKDLGVSETPGEVVDPFPLVVGNEIEVPAQIAVRYRNVSADWNTGTEFADRGETSSLISTQTVDMPFGLTPAQAKKIADTILKDAVAGLGRATLRVGGRKHAKYVEGDVLTTTAPDGTGYRFRIITKRDYLFMLEWEVALDDASALTSPAITFEGYVPTTDPLRIAPTEWEVLAIPPLQDSDASVPGPYVAIAPARNDESDEWPGAVFVRARLPEAFEQVFISGDVSVMGVCQTVLGDFVGGSTVLDWTQKLRVRVRGELASADYYDFFADRTINAAVVGDEPIRFLRADFVSTDGLLSDYDLSGLMRGQLGQEHLTVGHSVVERFVLLTPALRRMANQTTDIGQEHQVKAVTLNTLLSNVTDEDFTDDGIALRPYSPVALNARAQVSGDLDIEWSRRSRLVARYTDQGVFAPLGEATEAYRVKIYDDPDADPIRTENVTTPEYTYAAADIASDGFSSGDPITITVQQLSETVGEGFAATLEVDAP